MTEMLLPVCTDEGAGQIKTAILGSDGSIASSIQQSIIAEGAMTQGAFYADGVVETEEGTTFTIDASHESYYDTRTRGYQLSEEIRSLTHYSLLKQGLAGKKLHLYVTLPVENYYLKDSESRDSADRRNLKVIEQKKENLKKSVSFLAPEYKGMKIHVEEVTVMPEAIPLVLDAAIDDNGQVVERFRSPVNVVTIDIGANTDDLAYMSVDAQNSQIKPMKVLTRHNSYYFLLEKLRHFLESDTTIPSSHISHKVLRAITRGKPNQLSQNHPEAVQKAFDKAVHQVVRGILADIEGVLPKSTGSTDPRLIPDYYVCGGGGYSPIEKKFTEAMARLGVDKDRIIMPEGPSDLSLVRGIAKFVKGL